MAQAILHNITPVAKCCILVRLDSSMVGYDDWDGPFVLPTRTRDIRGFGLDFSERLGREPGDEETESIGISERDDFDKTVCMYHHRNAILVLTLEHSHVISAINHSLSSLTRMVLVLHHRKTLRSFEFRPSPPRDLISNESYLGGGVSSLRRPPPGPRRTPSPPSDNDVDGDGATGNEVDDDGGGRRATTTTTTATTTDDGDGDDGDGNGAMLAPYRPGGCRRRVKTHTKHNF